MDRSNQQTLYASGLTRAGSVIFSEQVLNETKSCVCCLSTKAGSVSSSGWRFSGTALQNCRLFLLMVNAGKNYFGGIFILI